MLRAVIWTLVVANAGYFAWSRGTFAAFGWVPASLTETEPQRLANQLRPGLLQIRIDDAAAPAAQRTASAPASVVPVESAVPATPATSATPATTAP